MKARVIQSENNRDNANEGQQRVWRLAARIVMLLITACGLALADAVPKVPCPDGLTCIHNLVYIAENGTAFYLLANQNSPTGFIRKPLTYEMVNGVATVETGTSVPIKLGDIALEEPDGTPSDLIRMVKGGKDSKGRPLSYHLEFYSDVDPSNPQMADVGVPLGRIYLNAWLQVEQPIAPLTKDWRFDQNVTLPNPNNELNLGGKTGWAYVAYPASANHPVADIGSTSLAGESPVAYVFVSDDSTPEPASLVLFGSGVLGVGGVLRRRLHARS